MFGEKENDKYLGILKAEIDEEITKEYIRRTRKFLETKDTLPTQNSYLNHRQELTLPLLYKGKKEQQYWCIKI